MQLLPAVNDVVAVHCAGDAVRCRHCAVADPGDCPILRLAAGALDVIIQCWRLARSERDHAPEAAPRDLQAAVGSKQLTSTEADALTEILGVLELAGKQADDAGTCLPVLAGIGIAVVDTYRAAVAEVMSKIESPDTPGRFTPTSAL